MIQCHDTWLLSPSVTGSPFISDSVVQSGHRPTATAQQYAFAWIGCQPPRINAKPYSILGPRSVHTLQAGLHFDERCAMLQSGNSTLGTAQQGEPEL